MSKERISFKVERNKFWILEQRLEEEHEAKARKPGEKEEYRVNAWVFNNEQEAIEKLRNLITQEKIDFDKLEEIEKIGTKYNLQEVEIAREIKKKYDGGGTLGY